MAKRLGIVPHFYAQPLFHHLKQEEERRRVAALPALFELIRESPADLALKLRQESLDGAFLSPIDYAREYSGYQVVPEVAAVSFGASGAILLAPSGQVPLSDIHTISVDVHSATEIVLTNIIFKERFERVPQFIPYSGSTSLPDADAHLLTGNAALNWSGTSAVIDLVGEWKDLTDLPFVHGFWVLPAEHTFTEEEIQLLIRSGKESPYIIDFVLSEADRAVLDEFYYFLDNDAFEGLSQFFRTAFYHGILKDVPDVKLLPLPTPTDETTDLQ